MYGFVPNMYQTHIKEQLFCLEQIRLDNFYLNTVVLSEIIFTNVKLLSLVYLSKIYHYFT